MAISRICSIPNCDKPAKARGWCSAHYRQQRLLGAPKVTRSACSVDGCTRKHYGRGYCEVHIRRLARNGGTHRVRAAPHDHVAALQAALVSDTNDCIDWPYGTAGNVYAPVTITGRTVLAHRYVCEQAHGLPPKGFTDAAHSCGRKRCINPRHLRWATRKQNSHDMLLHGTRIRGEKHGMAKLTDELARQIKHAKGNNSEVARRFGVRRETARDIRNGKRWVHV